MAPAVEALGLNRGNNDDLADYLDCAFARLFLCRWRGFAQVPSDREQFTTVGLEAVDGPWFFSAALVGPIANLIVAPLSESQANASCGTATANTPIPTSRITRSRMFMIDPRKDGSAADITVVPFRRDMKPALLRVGKLLSTSRHVRKSTWSLWRGP
jgi:hypothetical protein